MNTVVNNRRQDKRKNVRRKEEHVMKQEEMKAIKRKPIRRMSPVVFSIIGVILIVIMVLILYGCGQTEAENQLTAYAENDKETIELTGGTEGSKSTVVTEDTASREGMEERGREQEHPETLKTKENVGITGTGEIETKSAVGNEDVPETEKVAEMEDASEIENIAENKKASETGSIVENKDTSEAENITENKDSLEKGSTGESKDTLETENIAEMEDASETEKVTESEDATETEKTTEGASEAGGTMGEQDAEGTQEANEVQCVHDYQKSYWPSAPTCSNGADYVMVCTQCGAADGMGYRWEDALPHTPVSREEKHGNCVEYTIMVMECCVCGLELGRDGYYENEHDWVEGTYEEFNLETLEWETQSSTYCSRCGRHQ